MSDTYDIVIKGGNVFDGVSDHPQRVDLGIVGDKIVRIGVQSERASKIINAQGLAVMPGFIDVHTHSDSPFKLSRRMRDQAKNFPSVKGNWNYLLQGVTTVISGNCGEGFDDLNYWFDYLKTLQFGTNVFHLAPHGQIRTSLLGGNQPRVPTSSQLSELKARTAEIMEMGAVGMSTGLVYAPGFLAQTDEIVAMAAVAARFGGLYVSHIRDESGRPTENGEPGVLKAIKEAIDIGRRAGLAVHISHLKIDAPFNGVKAEQVLELLEKARDEGMDVTADQYPYTAGSSRLTLLVPADYLEFGGVKEEFKTQKGMQEIREAATRVFSWLPPEKIQLSECRSNRDFEGLNLKEISEKISRKPEDLFADLVSAERPPLAVFNSQEEPTMRKLMSRDYVFTASDGWTCLKDHLKPHPRCYGTFIRKIKKYCLEEKVMPLGAAIRSMTSLPAGKFKLKKRGRIAEGSYADLTILNLDNLSDEATYLDPHQYPKGVEYVLVNGIPGVELGKPTKVEAGRTLRKDH
ncbi:MAG: amidohydrolase family protein [Thermodesulfobacteriota bacterium]